MGTEAMRQSEQQHWPDNLLGLRGKRALVTGASGQLGSDIVRGLLASGACVLATDTTISALNAAKARWSWPDDRVKLAVCDVRNRLDVVDAISGAVTEFGGLDMLVNNAGVSVFEPWLERPETSIDWVMDVNIKGVILCTQEFVKHRINQGGGGSIVNVASHYGVISPDPRIYTDCDRKNSEIYGATKAGIIQMTRYFAVHLAGQQIRVNAVSPGGVRNPDNPQGSDFQANYSNRCPMRRMAEIREIIGPILFLLSPGASYVNGHNLIVDGAMSCW
jgi:NAD(P)-dependent dehydrogenase (short-subunit alcohol dehydrogenase family)